MKTMLTLIAALICGQLFAQSSTLTPEQNLYFQEMKVKRNPIVLCNRPLENRLALIDEEVPQPTTFITKALNENRSLKVKDGCAMEITFEVNCSGDIGNYSFLVDATKDTCRSYFDEVAKTVLQLKKVSPMTMGSQPVDNKGECRVRRSNTGWMFYVN